MTIKRPQMGDWVVAQATLSRQRRVEFDKKDTPKSYKLVWDRDDTQPLYGMYVGFTNVYEGETVTEYSYDDDEFGYHSYGPQHIFVSTRTLYVARLVLSERHKPVFVMVDDIVYDKTLDQVQRDTIERYAPLNTWVKAINRQGPDGTMSPLGIIDDHKQMKGWEPGTPTHRYLREGYACHITWDVTENWYNGAGMYHGEWFDARSMRRLIQEGEFELSAEKPEWSPLYE